MRRRALEAVLLLFTFLTLELSPVHGGDLRKVWEIDLKDRLQGKSITEEARYAVILLEFSPDGNELAIAVAEDLSKARTRSHLFVVDVQQPDARIPHEVSASVRGKRVYDFGWSPDGQHIYAAGTVIKVAVGPICNVSGLNAVVGNDRLINVDLGRREVVELRSGESVSNGREAIRSGAESGNQSEVGSAPRRTRLRAVGFDCQAIGDSFDLDGVWRITGVSIDRGVLLMESEEETIIVDPIANSVVRRWSGGARPRGVFADYGQAICWGSSSETADVAPISCWDSDSGERISVAPTANGGLPLKTATQSMRVVVSDNSRRRDPLSWYEYESVFRRRVVWDFRSGKELLSWLPPFQTYKGIARNIRDPYEFAISPNGEYVAEGGNGIVRLYKIEPGNQ